jgi:hypothetical protein
VCIRDILDILNTMLTWRCTKCVTSRYGKCHNIRENEIGELYTILSAWGGLNNRVGFQIPRYLHSTMSAVQAPNFWRLRLFETPGQALAHGLGLAQPRPQLLCDFFCFRFSSRTGELLRVIYSLFINQIPYTKDCWLYSETLNQNDVSCEDISVMKSIR